MRPFPKLTVPETHTYWDEWHKSRTVHRKLFVTRVEVLPQPATRTFFAACREPRKP